MRLTSENLNILKSYVYMYIDPRNNEIFYIGKGKNGRVYAHLRDTSEHDKTARIAKIRQAGQEPQIDFLRYGLSDSEAMLVEAVAIDLIGKSQLTNKASGSHKESFGRISEKDLKTKLNPITTSDYDKVNHMTNVIMNGCYVFDLKMLNNGYADCLIYSSGKLDKNRREIRQPCLSSIKDPFSKHDLIIGNKQQYKRWLNRKGWGLITKQYLDDNIPEWLNPHGCHRCSMEIYIDIKIIKCSCRSLDVLCVNCERKYHDELLLSSFPFGTSPGDFMLTRCKIPSIR